MPTTTTRVPRTLGSFMAVVGYGDGEGKGAGVYVLEKESYFDWVLLCCLMWDRVLWLMRKGKRGWW